MSEVILYLADKLVDFLLAVLLIVIGYYINKWLDRRK
nr:MAG TPA: TM helix protein [Caudoviricetes sp.]